MSDLSNKKRDAMAAKARLDRSVSALKDGFEPQEIVDTVGDSAKGYIRRTSARALRNAQLQPARMAAAGAVALLYLFRKPIARAIFARRKRGDDHG